MLEIIAEFSHFIETRDGTLYAARVEGRARDDGAWDAWLEFLPFEGAASHFTDLETTLPDRDALLRWARALTDGYLEDALSRAVHPAPPGWGSTSS